MRQPLFLLFLFLFLPPFALAQAPINYENQLIHEIHIDFMNVSGDAPEDPAALLSRLNTKKGEYFSQEKFDQDLKQLNRDFDRVDPIVQSVEGQITITLKIWLRPVIRSICFQGNQSMDRSTLLKELGIAPLTIFDRTAFVRAFHKLKAFYVKKGYFEAQLWYNIERDPSTHELNITIYIDEGRSGWIREMIFDGFTEEEKNEILGRISSRLYNVFKSWFTQEGTYNEEAVRQDEYIIADYLQNRGYADATVRIRVKEIAPNALALVITANRGPLYTFGSITFDGNQILCNNCILQAMEMESGQPFSMEKIRQTIDNITRLYGRRGYIDALVNFDPHLVPGSTVYNVHFTIDEDRQYRIGLITIFGNNYTESRVILNEALLAPGEVFDAEKLTNTEIRLLNTDFFKNVNVYAVKSDESSCLGPDYRDIHIEVEEKSTGSFNITFGISTTEGLFGSIELKEKNFNVRGFRKLAKYGLRSLRGGGEYLHLNSTIGTKTTSYTLNWVKPHICETPWTLGFDVAQVTNRYVSEDYQLRSLSTGIQGTYDVNPFVKWGCHYRLKYSYTKQTGKPKEIDNNDEGPIDRMQEILQDAEEKKESKGQYEKETNLRGIISAAGIHWSYNSTNHPAYPTKGVYSRLELECAGFGGPFKFLYFAYLNSSYIPVKTYGFCRFRADFKFLAPYGRNGFAGIPMDERLFLGDDTYVRGYRPYKLGPVFDDKPDAPRGGASLEYFSAQYNHFLIRNIEGFVFADAGGLTINSFDFFPRLFFSVGVGTRFQVISSLPPIEMGFGFPLNAQTRGQKKKFFLSIGGRF